MSSIVTNNRKIIWKIPMSMSHPDQCRWKVLGNDVHQFLLREPKYGRDNHDRLQLISNTSHNCTYCEFVSRISESSSDIVRDRPSHYSFAETTHAILDKLTSDVVQTRKVSSRHTSWSEVQSAY
eukprot:6208119-Pleurochrysis_carterae.AAC.2